MNKNPGGRRKGLFEKQINKTEVCHIWTGGKDKDGYGLYNEKRVHRMVWEVANGPIPKGQVVRHLCEKDHAQGDFSYRACVRLEHLSLGSVLENSLDSIAAGRHPKGEQNPRTKLSDAQVAQVKELVAQGLRTQTSIAQEFGVSSTLIRFLVNGRSREPKGPRLPEHSTRYLSGS